MILRRFLLILLLALFTPALAQEPAKKAPAAKPWEKMENVTIKPGRWDDGDSFHVITADGRDLIFRLYFVDTCEEEKVYADRIRDQAAYFGISEEQTKGLGHQATAFTRKLLEKPFTLYTRWRNALGRSKQDRHYAMIITADGKDLAKELIRNGLARIYGTRTVTWDNRLSKTYLAELAELEAEAKREKRGGWAFANQVLIEASAVK